MLSFTLQSAEHMLIAVCMSGGTFRSFSAYVHLHSACCTSGCSEPGACYGVGLYGRFPEVLPIVAAKFQTLELRNTSLLQCNASHVDSLANAANGTVRPLPLQHCLQTSCMSASTLLSVCPCRSLTK